MNSGYNQSFANQKEFFFGAFYNAWFELDIFELAIKKELLIRKNGMTIGLAITFEQGRLSKKNRDLFIDDIKFTFVIHNPEKFQEMNPEIWVSGSEPLKVSCF